MKLWLQERRKSISSFLKSEVWAHEVVFIKIFEFVLSSRSLIFLLRNMHRMKNEIKIQFATHKLTGVKTKGQKINK